MLQLDRLSSIFILSVTILFSGLVQASDSVKEGGVVAYFSKTGNQLTDDKDAYYYRKLIAIDENHNYLIQDFFVQDDNKKIDPIVISDSHQLTHWRPKSLEGALVLWDEEGKKIFSRNYKEGKMNGKVVTWYPNGQKKEESHYTNDVANGLLVQWYKNGQKSLEGSIVNGKKDGRLCYWYENGNRKEELHYKNGVLEGPYTLWYENGHKKNSGMFSANEEEGIWTYWDENGVKTNKVTFQKGKIIDFDSEKISK